MGDDESVQEYFDKVFKVVNRLSLMGEDVYEKRIVNTLLVSLLEKFEGKISSLKDSKDLRSKSVTELLNALQAQEQRRTLRQNVYVEGVLMANKLDKKEGNGN